MILLETFSGLSLQQFSDEYPTYPIQSNNVYECIFGTDNIFLFFFLSSIIIACFSLMQKIMISLSHGKQRRNGDKIYVMTSVSRRQNEIFFNSLWLYVSISQSWLVEHKTRARGELFFVSPYQEDISIGSSTSQNLTMMRWSALWYLLFMSKDWQSYVGSSENYSVPIWSLLVTFTAFKLWTLITHLFLYEMIIK